MTVATIGKLVGIAAAASVTAVGAFKAGRAAASEPATQPAQPTISAPAATSADIAALRDHFDKRFDDMNARQDVFNGRLSNVEGYMAGQREAQVRAR